MEVQGITSSSISLSWKTREGAYNYRVKYRGVDRGVQETFKVKNTPDNHINLRNLKCNTLYEIKVYIEDTNGDEFYLDKIEQETRESFAIQLTEKADKIIDEVISVYQLRVKERQLGFNKNIKVYEYFSEIYNSEERTLLVVGASGSGKSTMINAIVNFVADVSFTERFRYKIAEEKCQTGSSRGANRANVTCYRIRHRAGFRIGYNLNMIEVPELDDLSLKNGNYLYVIQQLIDLLGSGEIKFIHAACLVVPSFSRLRNEQKCIFENIVSIFEKNINHIIPLITHNDGGCMNELSSLTKVGVSVSEQLYFRFNNSMLYNCAESEIIWNDREDSMNNLFKQIKTVPSVNTSVGQTLKVLQTRKHFIQSLEQAEFQKKEIQSKTEKSSSNDDNKVCENDRPHKRSKGSKIISCNICGKICNDNYSCSIRFNLYLAWAFEFILMFCVCCCPCFFPILCKCGNLYCLRLKCIQQLIGCNCPCAIAHHYVEDRENASIRIKYELKSLKEAFMTTYCYITEDQYIINKSALQTDLSEELQARIDNLSIFFNNIQTNDDREIENKT